MGDEGSDFFGNPRIALILLGIGSAAVVVAIYHCISMGWCKQHQRTPGPPRTRTFTPQDVEMHSSIELSTAQLVPAHKFHKGMGLVGDDSLCAVCLCEFEEDEELRTLPGCSHSYHASCIDMWLYSHSNCPICRTHAGLLPQIFRPPEINSEDLQSGMLQNVVIQSTSRIVS